MNLSDMPARSIAGRGVLPNLIVLRREYVRDLGPARGHEAIERLPVRGWYVVYDLRDDGLPDGFICQNDRPDGSSLSIAWDSHQIARVLRLRPNVC